MSVKEMVGKYVASWGEPDPGIRRQVIAELWSAEAVYANAAAEFRGRDGIEKAVTEAWDMFMSKGFTTRVGRVDAHHDAVRYTWELYAPDGAGPVALGTQVVTLDEQGRMLRDFQFVDRAPEGLID
jgi:nuclear transport factor 2 (NTF2) superfamily protein